MAAMKKMIHVLKKYQCVFHLIVFFNCLNGLVKSFQISIRYILFENDENLRWDHNIRGISVMCFNLIEGCILAREVIYLNSPITIAQQVL